jgi:glutamine amidotransferase
MIAIIDYDVGNRGSIANMLRKLGCEAVVTRDPAALRSATKLILPGIGAFDHGMQKLAEHDLIDVLNERVLTHRVPVLGICLGMQLFGQGSEEGSRPGLGWVAARSVRFRSEPASPLKIPHMGWNTVTPAQPESNRLGLGDDDRFYFVHSFHVVCEQADDVLATATYGEPFTAALGHGNIVGVQFHPEKSHRYGLRLLRWFAESN